MAKARELKPLENDLQAELQDIADKEQVTIIGLVAPKGVRTSPITFESASIEEDDIYRLEDVVKKAIKQGSTSSLHLIIHTPGGELHASYKIANFLRSKFTNISAFVPYEAASGGTIICCAANDLYVGELGNITAIDPQIRYKGFRVSCYAFIRAVELIQRDYGEESPAELPTPWHQMSDKLDPVIHDEMNTLLTTAIIYADRLLEKSGYEEEKAFRIAIRLGRNSYTHEFPIFADTMKEMGFNLKQNDQIMKVYGKLVSCRLQEQFPRHAIDAFYPKNKITEPENGAIQESSATII